MSDILPRGKTRLGPPIPTDEFCPFILPAGWSQIHEAADGRAYRSRQGLIVLVSADMERDGRRWLHVSTSRKDRIPSYDDLVLVKILFIGETREAYQCFVPKARHFNAHPFCLHLWCCLDATDGVLPDFSRGGEGI
jgi:hypothetical protein